MFLKTLRDGEHKFFVGMQEQRQVSSVKIFCWLIYQEVSIYLKYYKPDPLLKIDKMWQKVDVQKNACVGVRNEMKEGYKVSYVKILMFG